MTSQLDDVGFTPTPSTLLHGTCDQCGPGTIAYLFVEVNGLPLSFCGYHGTRHYDRLFEVGKITADQRYLLDEAEAARTKVTG